MLSEPTEARARELAARLELIREAADALGLERHTAFGRKTVELIARTAAGVLTADQARIEWEGIE